MTMGKRALIGGLTAVIVIVVGVTAYIQGKQYVARKEVKRYLAAEGYNESDIAELDSFMANLSSDKNWMVVVELQKDDAGHYFYYYDLAEDKVVLESYTLDGEEYDSPEMAKGK